MVEPSVMQPAAEYEPYWASRYRAAQWKIQFFAKTLSEAYKPSPRTQTQSVKQDKTQSAKSHEDYWPHIEHAIWLAVEATQQAPLEVGLRGALIELFHGALGLFAIRPNAQSELLASASLEEKHFSPPLLPPPIYWVLSEVSEAYLNVPDAQNRFPDLYGALVQVSLGKQQRKISLSDTETLIELAYLGFNQEMDLARRDAYSGGNLERQRILCRMLGHAKAEAVALWNLSLSAAHRGSFRFSNTLLLAPVSEYSSLDDCLQYYEESLRYATELGHLWLQLRASVRLARAHFNLGNDNVGERYMRQTVEIARYLKLHLDPWVMAELAIAYGQSKLWFKASRCSSEVVNVLRLMMASTPDGLRARALQEMYEQMKSRTRSYRASFLHLPALLDLLGLAGLFVSPLVVEYVRPHWFKCFSLLVIIGFFQGWVARVGLWIRRVSCGAWIEESPAVAVPRCLRVVCYGALMASAWGTVTGVSRGAFDGAIAGASLGVTLGIAAGVMRSDGLLESVRIAAIPLVLGTTCGFFGGALRHSWLAFPVNAIIVVTVLGGSPNGGCLVAILLLFVGSTVFGSAARTWGYGALLVAALFSAAALSYRARLWIIVLNSPVVRYPLPKRG